MSRQAQPDRWTERAQAEGLRARSAYKLRQILDRTPLVRPGMRILECGAAPGGWSVVLAEILGEAGTLVTIDLQEMDAIAGCTWIHRVGDLTAAESLDWLGSQGPYNVILSDMAPATTGNKQDDAEASIDLVRMLEALWPGLKPGAHLIAKVFQGKGFPELLRDWRSHFGQVKTWKPPASRKASPETYVVAQQFEGS